MTKKQPSERPVARTTRPALTERDLAQVVGGGDDDFKTVHIKLPPPRAA